MLFLGIIPRSLGGEAQGKRGEGVSEANLVLICWELMASDIPVVVSYSSKRVDKRQVEAGRAEASILGLSLALDWKERGSSLHHSSNDVNGWKQMDGSR